MGKGWLASALVAAMMFASSPAHAIAGGTESAHPWALHVIVSARSASGDPGFRGCTGARISDRVVITAKHCLVTGQDVVLACSAVGDPVSQSAYFRDLVTADAVTVEAGPRKIGVSAVETYPTTTACRDDLALLRLAEAPTGEIAKIRLAPRTRVAERLTIVGVNLMQGQRERTDVTIDAVGPESAATADETPLTPARMFRTKGGYACEGDSGGPAVAGNGAVLGVVSRLEGDCGSDLGHNHFVSTGSHASWISETLAKWNETANVEEPELGTACSDIAPCASGHVCQSGLCAMSMTMGGAAAQDMQPPEEKGCAFRSGSRSVSTTNVWGVALVGLALQVRRRKPRAAVSDHRHLGLRRRVRRDSV